MKTKRLILSFGCAMMLVCVFSLVGCFEHPLYFKRFSSAEDAVEALDAYWRKNCDTSLDICPPYKLKYSFDCDDRVIIFYSYCYKLDGTESSIDYVVGVLKRHRDGSLSFVDGYAMFSLHEPESIENLNRWGGFFTNIKTDEGKRSISLLYLERDSDKEIYVDGIKAERIPVSIDGREFDICFVISRPDTLFTFLFSHEDFDRHTVEIR